jgi:hypothetical protein
MAVVMKTKDIFRSESEQRLKELTILTGAERATPIADPPARDDKPPVPGTVIVRQPVPIGPLVGSVDMARANVAAGSLPVSRLRWRRCRRRDQSSAARAASARQYRQNWKRFSSIGRSM